MPKLYSKQWDENLGACVKHAIPETPCPQCLAEKDPDITVILTRMDREMLAWNPSLPISSFFSKEEKWLEDRIQ